MRFILTASVTILASISAAHAQIGPPPSPAGTPPPSGAVISTPRGPGVEATGTQSYQQLTGPSGAGGIMTPNSNGTSTITSPSGAVQTVPSPR